LNPGSVPCRDPSTQTTLTRLILVDFTLSVDAESLHDVTEGSRATEQQLLRAGELDHGIAERFARRGIDGRTRRGDRPVASALGAAMVSAVRRTRRDTRRLGHAIHRPPLVFRANCIDSTLGRTHGAPRSMDVQEGTAEPAPNGGVTKPTSSGASAVVPRGAPMAHGCPQTVADEELSGGRFELQAQRSFRGDRTM
jgi:hypothetical protein